MIGLALQALGLPLMLLSGFPFTIETGGRDWVEWREGNTIHLARGTLTCYPDRAEIRLAQTAPFRTLLHELAHAVECKQGIPFDEEYAEAWAVWGEDW